MRVKIDGNIIEVSSVCAYIEKLVKIDESYQLITKYTPNDNPDVNCLKFFDKSNQQVLCIRNLPNSIVRDSLKDLVTIANFDFDIILIKSVSNSENPIKYYLNGSPFYNWGCLKIES